MYALTLFCSNIRASTVFFGANACVANNGLYQLSRFVFVGCSYFSVVVVVVVVVFVIINFYYNYTYLLLW